MVRPTPPTSGDDGATGIVKEEDTPRLPVKVTNIILCKLDRQLSTAVHAFSPNFGMRDAGMVNRFDAQGSTPATCKLLEASSWGFGTSLTSSLAKPPPQARKDEISAHISVPISYNSLYPRPAVYAQ